MGLPGELDGGRLALAEAPASAAVARLDQQLLGHPLHIAFLYRALLDAVQRQATVDGAAIDPWHLAAAIEGLRLRIDPSLRIIDRRLILDAARVALKRHQWLAEPDLDQASGVQRPGAALATEARSLHPSLAAGRGFRSWIEAGEGRAPMRPALIRFWLQHGLLHDPVPLTGATGFQAEQASQPALWIPAFLRAITAGGLMACRCCRLWSAPGLLRAGRSSAGAGHRTLGRRRHSCCGACGLGEVAGAHSRDRREECHRPAR